jgi:hypothetical protein
MQYWHASELKELPGMPPAQFSEQDKKAKDRCETISQKDSDHFIGSN